MAKNKSRASSLLKRLDLFGRNILLTYQGDDKFKTNFGAVLSMLLIMLMVSFTLFKFAIMVNRSDFKSSKQSFVRNL